MDWTEQLHIMDRKRLEMLFCNTMGYLSTFEPHTSETPDEIFEFLMDIGKEDWETLKTVLESGYKEE